MDHLILELAEKGILLDISEGDLLINAPKGTLNDTLVNTIREQKEELIRYLSGNLTDEQEDELNKIMPVEEQPFYPLSSSQNRLWILSQFKEGNVAYNMSGAYVFEGILDRPAFEHTFQDLIRRHESLRTVFRKNGGDEASQVIQAPEATGFKLRYKDFRGKAQRKSLAAAAVQEEVKAPFDLAEGPLLRAGLYQLEDNKWIFTYTMHHIISDGWSMGVLIKELMQLYNAYINGDPSPLQPLRIQYKDYAAWQQHNQQEGNGRLGHKAYWLQQFEGSLPVLNLCTDRPRPAIRTHKGANVQRTINIELARKLKTACRQQGATLYMGLMAMVNTLLYKYTRQEDIVIGRVVSGREHNDLEDQIGFYTNTLALRTQFSGADSYRMLLNNTRQLTLAAYEHRTYPFDELVREMGLGSNAGRNPLFDVMVELRDMDMESSSAATGMENLQVKHYEFDKQVHSKFDLTFFFAELENGLSMLIEYNTDLFNAASIERMGAHFEQLLMSVLNAPDMPLHQLSYMSRDEQQLLTKTFNDTAIDYPEGQTVLTLFRQQVKQMPGSVVLIYGGEEITYEELNKRAMQLAAYLKDAYQVHTDDLVGIMLDRSEHIIVSILGVLMAGAAYVPVDPSYPEARKEFILRDTGAKVLITQSDYIYALSFYQGSVLAIDLQSAAMEAYTGLSDHEQPGNLAYVIYTSGSTGTPKGCIITHSNLFNYINWANGHYFNTTGHAHFPLFTSTSFDLTVTSIFCSLTQGGSLRIYDQQEELTTILAHSFSVESGINCIKLTPSHINILEQLGIAASAVQCAIVGGEEVLPGHVDILKRINPAMEIYNEYGPTEATVGCVVAGLHSNQPVLIGKPVANAGIYILDNNGALCAIGVPGEIFITGKGVSIGYLNNEQLTAGRFVPDPFRPDGKMYKTGDLGRWLPDGNLEYMGRIDEQVKINGYRIELGEIENVLLKHEAVMDAVVLTKTNRVGEKELFACYVPGNEGGDMARKVAENESKGLPAGAKLYELPNGLSLYAYNNSEVHFLYEEVFREKCYLNYGVTMPENACIIDIGANIGAFSVFASLQSPGAKIYSFEPLPPTFELLKLNASLYPGNFHLFNVGISDKEETVQFSYFPNATVLSSRYAEGNDITEVVKQTISNRERLDNQQTTTQEINELLKDRLTVQAYDCRLKTLSQVIRENNIERIDYLKIDVEKSEMDVLNGIEENDWKKIKQIVLEIHDVDGRKDVMLKMLTDRGFKVQVNQNDYLADTGLYDVYAIAAGVAADPYFSPATENMADRKWYGPAELKSSVREFLKEKLPAYMIPLHFIQLNSIPLTHNGKVDKKALLQLEVEDMDTAAVYQPPRHETDEKLIAIWQDVLEYEKVGIRDNFFDRGGNSLKAMRLLGRISRVFHVEYSLDALFNHPTIEEIANEIERTNWASASLIGSNEINDTEIFSI